MKTKLGKKFWVTLVIFSLMGQVAWVVENMYFNVFIYKMFHATAADISMMVGASAIAATITTWLVGAFSDKVGKRKIFICGGYILWGISILTFALLRMDVLEQITGNVALAASLGVSLVITMDCVMTFFGSSANDACFNAWLTDVGDETNRGSIEGVNSMMPLVGILVVFGGFMAFDLDQMASWTSIYLIIGISVILIGILGFFLIEDKTIQSKENGRYLQNVLYSFRPSVMKANTLLYLVVGAFAVFGISIQIFMPYLILYYEKTLGMSNYVLIMAPAIILAAIITAFYGKLYDKLNFEYSVIPTIIILMLGYVLLYFCTGTAGVFIGSLLMMTGYLTGMAIFGAMIRDNTPEEKTGLFQGLRIFGQVFIPGIIGPAIGAAVLHNAETVVNGDGTTSFIPNHNIYLAAFVAAVVLLIVLRAIFYMMHHAHRKLRTDYQVGKIPFTEYPNPQWKRDSFFSLNGKWDNGILVPFAPQADLSGYSKRVGSHLRYSRHFSLPEGFVKDRVLLHFGAVDQIAQIYLNGEKLYEHIGGYLPFEVDITQALKEENELVVKVTDKLSHRYPYGKQRKNRGGMWYTPVSGIWQSVWVESVTEDYIEKAKITPDLKGITIEVTTKAPSYQIEIQTNQGSIRKECSEKCVRIEIEEPNHWTPENPYLYPMTITTSGDGVQTYFALRTVEVKDCAGVNRLCLNGKPYFFHGVLDQGYWSDGLFLPASEEGFKEDIQLMKRLGINTLRKHIKIEPALFYYWCDKLGMLVFQDMVNSGDYSFICDTALPTISSYQRKDTGGFRSAKRKAYFVEHTKETLEYLYNFPCIVYYTIFNEGWGQFDSDVMYDLVKKADPTRIIDSTSGWFKKNKSDVESLHIYYQTRKLEKTQRPLVVSECGGYSYVIPEHSYSIYSKYGYGTCENSHELSMAVKGVYTDMIIPAIEGGLGGCIYTQLSDVEDETNGLYTYDRKVCKVEVEVMEEIAQLLKEKIEEIGSR